VVILLNVLHLSMKKPPEGGFNPNI